MRRVPEGATNVHHDGSGFVLAFLCGVHVHRVLPQDARSAVYHEEIIAVFDIELSCDCFILDAGHFHEIEEMIAGGAQNAGAELCQEEKERRDNIVYFFPREFAIEEIPAVE